MGASHKALMLELSFITSHGGNSLQDAATILARALSQSEAAAPTYAIHPSSRTLSLATAQPSRESQERGADQADQDKGSGLSSCR
jgi:hypothetical protein